MKIFYHGDDYGVTLEQSQRIYDCFLNGKLNSVSIILNSPEHEKAFELIKNEVADGSIRCVAHLNFVEGKCMSQDHGQVSHLIDGNGMFNCSVAYVLKMSLSRNRNVIKEEFKNEIRAQLLEYARLIQSRKISVDSHRHYHMIPVVWDALCEVIKEENFDVEYLRLSVDPFKPVARAHMIFKVPKVNYVKWIFLSALRKYCRKHNTICNNIPVFFGMPFTGQMTSERVKKLLPGYIDVASKTVRDLELMFHPGAIRDTAQLLDSSNADLVQFYSSVNRDLEKEYLTE